MLWPSHACLSIESVRTDSVSLPKKKSTEVFRDCVLTNNGSHSTPYIAECLHQRRGAKCHEDIVITRKLVIGVKVDNNLHKARIQRKCAYRQYTRVIHA